MKRTLFLAVLGSVLTIGPSYADETVDQYRARVYAELDANRDGAVRPSEVLDRFGSHPSFGRYDTNGDGRLTGGEISTIVNDAVENTEEVCTETDNGIFETDYEKGCLAEF